MKTVMVTGAARGIGRALVERLADAGDSVIAVDVDEPEVQLAHRGRDRVLALHADVADLGAVQTVVGAALERFGQLDGVINNAGLHARAYNVRCLEMANDTWIRMLQVNLIGPLNVCRCTAPALTEAKGTIVNISSMSGYAFDPPTAYAVSKAALNALTTCLAMELGAVGIAVVGVAPGLVGTEVVVGGMSDESLHYYLDTQAIPEIIEPHEMAAFVDSLLGESARLMTGHTVLADRGYVRGR